MDNSQLLVLTVLVLLPMIPAFLLFKLLPSRAVVRGPLAGLNVALGGAFAGYVALTVFVATFWAQSIKPPVKTYRIWRVSGQLQFPEGERPQVAFDFSPPRLMVDRTNSFNLDMAIPDGEEIPDLVLEVPGYAPKSIPLREKVELGVDYACRINDEKGRIRLHKPIVFEKPQLQTYAPQPQPQPVQIAGGL